jgi:hypothetical protein
MPTMTVLTMTLNIRVAAVQTTTDAVAAKEEDRRRRQTQIAAIRAAHVVTLTLIMAQVAQMAAAPAMEATAAVVLEILIAAHEAMAQLTTAHQVLEATNGLLTALTAAHHQAAARATMAEAVAVQAHTAHQAIRRRQVVVAHRHRQVVAGLVVRGSTLVKSDE